jgi:hypothetical protein
MNLWYFDRVRTGIRAKKTQDWKNEDITDVHKAIIYSYLLFHLLPWGLILVLASKVTMFNCRHMYLYYTLQVWQWNQNKLE